MLESFQRPKGELPVTWRRRANVESALASLRAAGHRPDTDTFVVSAAASSGRCHIMSNRSPCITASHFDGHWITSRRRGFTSVELRRLFGFPASYSRGGLSKAQFGRCLGNSMDVRLMAELLREVLIASRLAKRNSSRALAVSDLIDLPASPDQIYPISRLASIKPKGLPARPYRSLRWTPGPK